MDGESIKSEYVRTAIGYRRLAQKHGLDPDELTRQAKLEDWAGERRRYRQEQRERAAAGKRLERLQSVTDQLLEKLEQMVEAMDPATFPCNSLRYISGTLKDIKDIQLVWADMQEQEAKIESLRQKLTESGAQQVTVVLEGGSEDYAG